MFKAMTWLAFISCVIAVGYALFRPAPPAELFNNSDKVGHVVAFFCLSLTAKLALNRLNSWWLWGVLFAFAPLAEYLQGVLRPMRFASWEDAIANIAGVCIALLIFYVYKHFIPRFCNSASP